MKMLHILLFAAAFSILNFNATHGGEIINGKKPRKDAMQYMASVQFKNKHICGGFLIDPKFVLTAAHCFKSNLSVVLGTHNINPKRNNLRRYTVKSKHIPSSYNENPGDGFDIMLLKLGRKVNLNKGAKIISISTKKQKVKPNTKCQVAGWGKTGTQDMVNDLLVTDISTINITVCQKLWNSLKLPANILCAGGYKTKSGACQGDSGGPLVCSGRAVGIVSFNKKQNCKYPDVPNVYTEISPYVDWINKVIKGGA